MQIDQTTHKLRVIIMGHISLVGLSSPETEELESHNGGEDIVLKLLCSMQSLPQEQDKEGNVVNAMGDFRFTPEPIPMNMMGDGVEVAYKWNNFVNKAGIVCWSEIEMSEGEVGIVQEFSKFWGLKNA